MIDYKLLQALAKVVEEGGFERAARVLYLTQSAISQRVRQLEDSCGQVLLTRTNPPQPTAAGRTLLKHYQQVRMLEDGLALELTATPLDRPQSLTIGINADSLAFWFVAAAAPVLQEMNLLLDLRVADQEQTHRYLRDGEVVGCVSNEPRPMQGCRVEALGGMRYRLLATPEFCRRWFPTGLSKVALEQAPAVIFNRNDLLQQRFVERYFSGDPINFAAHYIPAPEQFLQVIAAGYCYGMVPDWQAEKLLKDGTLQEVVPAATLTIELYWHCWNLTTEPLQHLSAQLVSGARRLLEQEKELLF